MNEEWIYNENGAFETPDGVEVGIEDVLDELNCLYRCGYEDGVEAASEKFDEYFAGYLNAHGQGPAIDRLADDIRKLKEE